MAIMVAGGLTFAVPGTVPAAYAAVDQTNPHLFVSAEGQDADNQFAPGNIIEVIIQDDSIGDTDEGEAEPLVTINGADLRMLQAANGDWRAYFAQADAIATIDAMNGELDYGEYCNENAASTTSTLELSDTNGVYFPPGSVDATCGINGSDSEQDYHPLIRETRALTDYNPSGDTIGQLGLENTNLWPFIQVFDFAPESKVNIVYQKGGSHETVTLEFDDPSESHSLDRTKYPQGAHVLVTIEDFALNIDPTDEDTWAFDTNTKAAYYNLFDEDGNARNIMNDNITDYGGSAGIGERILIERSGQGGEPLIDCQVTKDFGIQEESDTSMDYLVSNDESNGACVPTDNIPSGSAAHGIFTADAFVIGFVEDGSNNNEFINWAEDQRSNLVVRDDAQRNRSFEIDYNDPGAISGVVGHFFAELTLGDAGATWNSGERISITVTDEDVNTNPLAENDLTVANPDSKLIPSIKIGSPITLASASGDVVWFDLFDLGPDINAPVITRLGVNPVTVEVGASYTDAGVTCADSRDGSLTPTVSGSNINTTAVGTHTVTYTCTDSEDNTSTATRTVNVVDTTAPVISLVGDPLVTIFLGEANYTDAGATCTDVVDGVLPVTDDADTIVDDQNKGLYTVTYTCADNSGNNATATRTVAVSDTTAPTPILRGSPSIEIPRGIAYEDEGAVCVDFGDPNPRLTVTNNVNTDRNGIYVVTYTCTDVDNNVVTSTRTVTVTDPDTTPPVLRLNGSAIVSVLQGSTYMDEGSICTDNKDPNPTKSDTAGNVNTTSLGNQVIVYQCTDASGNSAPPVSRTVNVIEPDRRPPIITLNDGQTTVVQNRNYTDPGITCVDNTDTNPKITSDADMAVDTSVLGPHTITYTCTDVSGNRAQETRTITVVEPDTDSPTIRLNGDRSISLTKGTTYNELGATCTDTTDGDLSVGITGSVDTSVVDTYELTYTCTDSSNNGANVTRTVIVIEDLLLETANVVGNWTADGDIQLSVIGNTAVPGVMLNADKAIDGFPMRIGAEFGTGNINQTITIRDISIYGPTEFYLTGSGGAKSNSISVDVPPALNFTGIAMTDGFWADGELTLTLNGTTAVSPVDLVAYVQNSDGTETMANYTVRVVGGNIDENLVNREDGTPDNSINNITVDLNNIALAGKTVQFKLMYGDVSSPGMTSPIDIPVILSLDSVEIDDFWESNELDLIVKGIENVSGSTVNLIAMPPGATDYTTIETIDSFVDTDTGNPVTLNDIRINGNTQFRLNITDATGNNTMSNAKTLNIPPIMSLSNVALADGWEVDGLGLDVTGYANVTNDQEIRLTIDGMEVAGINGLVINDDLTTDDDTEFEVLLTDSTYAGKTVTFGLTSTDDNETPDDKEDDQTVTVALRGDLRIPRTSLMLESVSVGSWNITSTPDDDNLSNDNNFLPITVVGNVGKTVADRNNDNNDDTDGYTVYLRATNTALIGDSNDDGAITIGTVTIDNTGKITGVTTDSTDSENDAINDHRMVGMTNFTLVVSENEVTNFDAVDYLVSNTVMDDVPPAMTITKVVEKSGWSGNDDATAFTLPLTITGYAYTNAELTFSALPTNPNSDTSTYLDTTTPSPVQSNSTTGLFTVDVTLQSTSNEESNKEFSFYVSNTASGIDTPAATSAAYNQTVNSAVILDDLSVKSWSAINKLPVDVTGRAFLDVDYDSAVLAMYTSEKAANEGNLDLAPFSIVNIDTVDRHDDGSAPIKGTVSITNTDLSGEMIYFRLQVSAGDDTVVSKIFRIQLPTISGGNNVELTPVPVSTSHSGFPPITRAVINDVSAIPVVHNVQQVMDPVATYTWSGNNMEVESFSDRLRLFEPAEQNAISGTSKIVIYDWKAPTFDDGVTTLFNWNFDSISHADVTNVILAQYGNHSNNHVIASGSGGLEDITSMETAIEALGDRVDLVIMMENTDYGHICDDITLVADFFTFGQTPEGDRVNNAIYRIEVEEVTPDNSDFAGTLEYVMLNQLNYDNPATYTSLRTINVDASIIVHEDFTDEDSVRINYFDLGADGVATQIAVQQEAPTHSGVVSFDADNYKIADTVTITLEDADLNVNNDVVDIYTFDTSGNNPDMIGDANAFILDVTFDDETWTAANCNGDVPGFASTGFTLMETASSSGIFTGDFQVPSVYCQSSTDSTVSVTGVDIEVNYQDFRDASGEEVEVGAGAAIRANTGTVSLDRTVYPVPFDPAEYGTATSNSLADYDVSGDLGVHIRVNDPDFDVSASGEDKIVNASAYLTVKIIRGAEDVTINLGSVDIIEVAPDAGIFELDLTISHDNGPDGLIQQGDIIQVEYRDETDASGEENTITDSATFDLRNAVLQSDKSVYLIGSDMILTLIEPDFDLDNDGAETYPLDLIEWDSDADTVAMGSDAAFDPEPNGLRETGDSTGIFQSIIEIPSELDGDRLERGEEIELEYVDYGPSGSDYVGDETEDINLTVATSNFGATVELDQKVYSWTDKVYITIVAPDHNFDSALVDEIGESDDDPIKVATRSADIDNYKLVETGPDTGIFTGEIILIGYDHNADGDTSTGTESTGYDNPQRETSGTGPTNGFIETDDEGGITVSFEFSEDETVVGSALIRWNIGEVQWLEASYPATGTGVVRVIDPDMNLNPESVDNFEVDIWSDKDAGGIDLTVTETNQATGIFEGTVFFTVADESSGHRLRVAEGNTVTAEYDDNTLPDPYTTADELGVTATTLIGSIVPPLERVPASNLRIVDAFENSLDSVSVDQQVQIVADITNAQERSQEFAYLVQVQDENGVTVSLAWISGTLEAGQSLSPSSSWIPTEAGEYTATAFVWESVDNPTALSPPVTTTITVS